MLVCPCLSVHLFKIQGKSAPHLARPHIYSIVQGCTECNVHIHGVLHCHHSYHLVVNAFSYDLEYCFVQSSIVTQ